MIAISCFCSVKAISGLSIIQLANLSVVGWVQSSKGSVYDRKDGICLSGLLLGTSCFLFIVAHDLCLD